jgi:hypothetical protein
MSRVTVAVGSFIAGVSSTLLFLALSGSHTSTLAQEPRRSGFEITGQEPIVKPLPGIAFTRGKLYGPIEQSLDGLNCDSCLFDNVSFTYAGGAARIINPKFSGTTRLVLKGAAANTMATVAFLQAMLQNQQPPAVNPNAPIIRTATTKEVFVADLVTPYGQK